MTSKEPKKLWYYPLMNRFKDDTGAIRHDLSLFFPTWELDLWKKAKTYAFKLDRQGVPWCLYFVDTNATCNHACKNCSERCYIYDMIRDW